MTSRDTLPCSATLGRIAALQKVMIAGFPVPGTSDKQEDGKPGVKPAGLIFCTQPNDTAVHHCNSMSCCIRRAVLWLVWYPKTADKWWTLASATRPVKLAGHASYAQHCMIQRRSSRS